MLEVIFGRAFSWCCMEDIFLEGQEKKDDNKEYTIKIIPHQDGDVHSIKLPAKLLKYGLASFCAGAVLFVGAFSYAVYSSYAVKNDNGEIQELRQVNSIQQEQLLQLAKKANSLQDEVDQLGQMENELRYLSGTESSQPGQAETGNYNGQGGPWVDPNVKNVKEALDNIEKNIAFRRESLQNLKETMQEQAATTGIQRGIDAMTPSIWPARGEVSSPYGLRWGGSDFHPGIDIANDYGTPVMATADGVVTAAGWNSGGYGNMVDIDHGSGLMTRYGHAQQVVVSIGQHVVRGQIIAYMGSTGFSTGPHVHYEVRVNGQAVNPVNYL